MTLAELRTLALQQTGIVAIGREPSAKDAAFVGNALTRALARLEPEGLALWTIDDTPDEFVDAFILFAAPMFAPTYGKPEYNLDVERAALRRLREIAADRNSSPVGEAEYF